MRIPSRFRPAAPLLALHEVETLARRVEEVVENVEQVILGKREVIEQTLIALLVQGHVLFEDIPGVGKTMLARAVAKSLGCSFKRIQATPDLLPADILGVSVYDRASGEFRFREGPIFANVVLVDEINRASPKTQSSLLECMEERQVTVDGISYPLPHPFFVIATQNPIEHEGVYPLPESQLDRFALRLQVGYPGREWERVLLQRQAVDHPIEHIGPVLSVEELRWMQGKVPRVHIEEPVYDYILNLIEATRNHPQILLGASARGSLWISRVARARAAVKGRNFVIPDDVKAMAIPVLAHRIILRPEAQLTGRTPQEILEEILEGIPSP